MPNCLTIAGIVNTVSGHFLPNFFAKIPAIAQPSIMPIDFNDVIHDACASVICPVGSGDLSEVSKKSAGLGQPFIRPKWNPSIDTAITQME